MTQHFETASAGGNISITPRRVLIFGTGSIGAAYAYVFSQAGASVTAVCRSNYSAAKSSGFTIHSTLWGDVNVRPAAVVQSVQEAASIDHSPFDLIVICAKSFPGSDPSTASFLAPAITPSHTAIALIQNGINIESEYASLYPTNPLLSCVVYLPATQTAPGTIVHREVELLHIGTYPAAAPATHKAAASQLAELVRKGGATAELHDDVQVERWKKLIVNASWNPICALARSRDAEIIHSSPGALSYVRNVMLEVTAVARASGYAGIDEKKVDFQMGRARARSLPGVEPSMLADALAGRAMEVEAIVGNTLRIAKEKGVECPLLKGLYVLLTALDGHRSR